MGGALAFTTGSSTDYVPSENILGPDGRIIASKRGFKEIYENPTESAYQFYHFNGSGFGPPWSFTSTSACSWLGHPVSGLWHTTFRPCQTRSRFGFRPEVLNHAAYHNSPDHSTKGTISHIDVLYVLVSTEFQVLFTPLPGFFSPFLHSTLRYRSLGSI